MSTIRAAFGQISVSIPRIGKISLHVNLKLCCDPTLLSGGKVSFFAGQEFVAVKTQVMWAKMDPVI